LNPAYSSIFGDIGFIVQSVSYLSINSDFMKSATKKLSAEIAATLAEKLDSLSAGSKKIKKTIEKAATKLAKKVARFEKDLQKKKARDEKKAQKKQKISKPGKKEKAKESKVAALVASASKVPAVAPPPIKPVPAKPAIASKPVVKSAPKPVVKAGAPATNKTAPTKASE
jgi:alanyl-tRNA synthetase